MKIVSINVNGLKAFYEKDAFDKLISEFDPDILCLQETKCSESKVGYWISDYDYKYVPFAKSNHFKRGYAGVATLIKEDLLNKLDATYYPKINALDEWNTYEQGRIVVSDFKEFTLVNVYTVNSGGKDEIRKRWDVDFYNYIQYMKSRKPVIIVGDLNVVPSELDYWGDYDNAPEMPGLKVFEYDNFNALTGNLGLVDSFRSLNPETRAYSWYSYQGGARANNKGWRIDLALVSREFMTNIISSKVFSEFEGSDHCPIMIEIKD